MWLGKGGCDQPQKLNDFMTMHQRVYSSHVESVSHDAATNELTVRWRDGKTSVYANVPEALAREVANAPSVGAALHKMVKPHYDHRYDK